MSLSTVYSSLCTKYIAGQFLHEASGHDKCSARDMSLPATKTETVVRQRPLGFGSHTRHETLGPKPFRIDKPGLVYV